MQEIAENFVQAKQVKKERNSKMVTKIIFGLAIVHFGALVFLIVRAAI